MNPMQSLKEKRLEEAKELVKKYANATYLVSEESHDVNEMVNAMSHFAEHFKESIDMAYEEGKKESNCPPHNFIPHNYEGNWGGSTPPPNMKCTKCLSTQYF